MATVIYDADCGFCRWSLAVLLSMDRRTPRQSGKRRGGGERGRPCPPNLHGRWARSAASYALRPLSLGTAEADRLLADLTVEERNASWHLVIDAADSPGLGGSARFSAGAALAPALTLLPCGRRPAAPIARMPRATERGYRWVAEHRGFLGRLVPARARRWADRVIATHEVPARPQ